MYFFVLRSFSCENRHEEVGIFIRGEMQYPHFKDVFSQYSVLELHSDLPQNTRTCHLQDFKKGRCKVLVGTDVMSRGLDIKGRASLVCFSPEPGAPRRRCGFYGSAEVCVTRQHEGQSRRDSEEVLPSSSIVRLW